MPADNYRYKYLNSTWIPVGESDILQKEAKHIYIHPNSKDPETATGDCWMKKQVNFKNVKISHNPASPHGDVSCSAQHAGLRMRINGLKFSAAFGSHDAQVRNRNCDKVGRFVDRLRLYEISRNYICRSYLLSKQRRKHFFFLVLF